MEFTILSLQEFEREKGVYLALIRVQNEEFLYVSRLGDTEGIALDVRAAIDQWLANGYFVGKI